MPVLWVLAEFLGLLLLRGGRFRVFGRSLRFPLFEGQLAGLNVWFVGRSTLLLFEANWRWTKAIAIGCFRAVCYRMRAILGPEHLESDGNAVEGVGVRLLGIRQGMEGLRIFLLA